VGARPPFGFVAVIVCDSVGCGHAPDADRFGDAGANTLGHVVEREKLVLPHLAGLGLDQVPGAPDLGPPSAPGLPACHGRMFECAPAKDTMVGHWELMGLVAERPFPVYPDGFPAEVIEQFGGLTGRAVEIVLDGGTLQVEWREDGVWMTGPTAHVFDGVLTMAFLEAV